VQTLKIESQSKIEMIDITPEVRRVVRESEVASGVCHIFVPHTTAALTINENTDPSIRKDVIIELLKAVPIQPELLNAEGNAAAHIMTSLLGASEAVFVENGKLALGTWQAIYLCEFDGPRSRTILLKVTAG